MSINFFWVIVAALNFILFLALISVFGFRPIANILAQRKDRIEQGLADADHARKDREGAAAERDRVMADARREAQALIAVAQKSAQELRDADIAAERDRALADLRAQVADLALAAAGAVVGESMTDARQRRIVEEFLAQDGRAQGRRN